MLFCRHSLEHSPFPYITLLEYNRVLRPNGYLYIEVPAPDGDRPHEENRNHYSILGRSMWLSLLKRSGFDVTWYNYEFPMMLEGQQLTEKYYIFVCQRKRPVDVK
jgi:SAM-dependent methyltransferase